MASTKTQTLYRFKCPVCFRVAKLPYDSSFPALPCCVGGPKIHPRQLLVCEQYDIYQEMLYRFAHDAPFAKPTINNRNYASFPIEVPGEKVQDIGSAHSKDTPL